MAFYHKYIPVARGARISAPDDPTRQLPVYDPQGLLGRIKGSMRRRLSDRVEDLFIAACQSADLETAEELLGVMENMHARRRARLGTDDRSGHDTVAAAREELARCRQRLSPGISPAGREGG